jgi:hypothetical protein
MCKTGKLLLSATATLALVLWAGCKTAPPKPSGFLSDYSRLQQVNDSTWRYVDKDRLSAYSKFTVPPAKVLVKQYGGTTFNAAQQEKIAATFRQKIADALSGRYQVVGGPAANVAEVRAAITQAYRVGNALALGVEVEIVDPESHQQLAALRGVQIGPPDVGFRMGYNNPADPSDYSAAWWSRPSAVELMERWAQEIRKTIEAAQQR